MEKRIIFSKFAIRMIQAFLDYLEKERGYSPLTVRNYGCDLRMLARFVCGGREEEFDPASLTLSDIRAWIAQQGARGLAPGTLRERTLAARSFFRYLRMQGVVDKSPVADLALPKMPRPLPAFVAEKDLERILSAEAYSQAAEQGDLEEYTRLLAVDILYSCGLRRAELLGLDDKDVDTQGGVARVFGKRSKERMVPLPRLLCSRIDTYRRLRDERHGERTVRSLFAGPRGGRMNQAHLSRIVKETLQSTGTSRKTPHVLRHSCATALLRHGARLDAVKQLLGHASLATTQIYTHLSFSELQHNYQQAHPRAKKE